MPSKKKKVNKSQKIRDYLKANPSAGPTAVSKGLASQGVKVTTALVSNVQHNMKNGHTRRGKRGKRVDLDTLRTAKQMADELGGVEQARQALDLLAELT